MNRIGLSGRQGRLGRPFGKGFSWSRYWATLISEKAYVSGSFDYSTNQWLDASGNGNNLNILSPYYAGNGGWGLEATNHLTNYGFTTYHEFVYNGGDHTLWSFGATTSNDKFMLLQIVSNKLRILHRVKNTTQAGTATLVAGNTYKLLVNWVDKDHIYVYINGATSADLSAESKDWAWQATWDRIGYQMINNGGTLTYANNATLITTMIKAGTCSWSTVLTVPDCCYYHTINPNINRNFDLSGNGRHLTLQGTAPTTKVYKQGVNPCLKNGYQICKRVSYGGTNYADICVPFDNNGTTIVNTANYPFRTSQDLPTRDREWEVVETVSASTTKYNGCDVRFAFPYNAMLATADADLGALFSGTTPNQLDPYSLWDDHLEKHILFFNRENLVKTSTGWQRWNNKTCDGINLAISDMVLFKSARTDYVKILKNQYGYHTTPTVVSSASYRMVTANDSFKLASTHLEAAKFAGLWDLFYEKDIANAPLKCRFTDVEKINHRNIFCNGSSLWIYPKPLLPSHFETALNTHLGLTDIENIITTADGVNYYDIDYERYVVTKDGAINLNPNATVAAKYDIFDRRNVVGTAKEIWHGDMVLGSAYWTWNLKLGTKKLYQPSVSKYIQTAYSGKLFIRQDWNEKNDLICPYIISFGTPLTGAAKTAMFAFIDFPETVIEPAIDGGGVVNDALAINTVMGSNAAVMLYEKTAKTQTSIAIPSGVQLILADSSIIMNNAINLNVVRNADFTGDENVRLTGYGVSVIDGNAANQVRNAYAPLTDSYKFINTLFGTVTNLIVKGLEIKDAAYWSLNLQMSDNALIEHIRFNNNGGQPNQDGLGLSFGTRYSIGRYITGKTNDDFIPTLNNDDTIAANIECRVNGTRKTEHNYYRNIRWDGYVTTGALGGQLIRLYDNQNYGIQNIEWQNIYGYKNNKTGFGESLSNILFSDYDLAHRSNAGLNAGYVFRNIRGSSTRNIRFSSGNYSNIDIDKYYVDDPNEATAIHIWVQAGIISDVNIGSVIEKAPDVVYQEDGGTLTNFVHTES